MDGLYVSIVPAGAKVDHTVDEPGNVIHAGVWTGRYLAGVEQSDVGWALHAALDASIAAIGAFIALFPIALVVGPPFRRAHSGAVVEPPVPDIGSAHALIARSTR